MVDTRYIGRILTAVLVSALVAACGESDGSRSTAPSFETQLKTLCAELGEEMASVGGDDTDPAVGRQLLASLERFRRDLHDLNPPSNRRDDFEAFVKAIDASADASARQVEATSGRNLVAALTARADAAESKLAVYEAVQKGGFPQECSGDTFDSLQARIFAGHADLICYDFVGRFGSVMGRNPTFDGSFVRDHVVPLWRDFVADLNAALPEGSSRPAAERMVLLYDRAGDALEDMAVALEQRSQPKGAEAQKDFYKASRAADRFATGFGLSQCTNLLGLSDANATGTG